MLLAHDATPPIRFGRVSASTTTTAAEEEEESPQRMRMSSIRVNGDGDDDGGLLMNFDGIFGSRFPC